MPRQQRTPCREPGCPELTLKRFCYKHERADENASKKRNRSKHKWYAGKRWRAVSNWFLVNHPWCDECGKPAREVHHITKHNGDYDLFWDESNWQALCKSCHSRKTIKGE